ncbi:hypothetical protein [Cyanobacterium aponinum]|uniref:Uncharacterized protein n=1 Tax=Cyanobacterium aponinum 0216 TaxID=2676140 RepID=A0A844GU00_9CHRO|nr:hypothetical protein [Cyanobacterium aponinum]MTF39043.1 hypothetical protein [Cyanobacterium aponinum 0216]
MFAEFDKKGLIYPNANTEYFKIVEYKQGFPYSFETGMSPLSYKQISEREKKLSYWKREIQDLEEDAKKALSKWYTYP